MTIRLEAQSLMLAREGKRVLEDVSFSVAAGETYALLGGNGAGKSTTLLAFLGFLTPSSGNVRVEGREVAEDVAAARAAISYLPEAAKPTATALASISSYLQEVNHLGANPTTMEPGKGYWIKVSQACTLTYPD